MCVKKDLYMRQKRPMTVNHGVSWLEGLSRIEKSSRGAFICYKTHSLCHDVVVRDMTHSHVSWLIHMWHVKYESLYTPISLHCHDSQVSISLHSSMNLSTLQSLYTAMTVKYESLYSQVSISLHSSINLSKLQSLYTAITARQTPCHHSTSNPLPSQHVKPHGNIHHTNT